MQHDRAVIKVWYWSGTARPVQVLRRYGMKPVSASGQPLNPRGPYALSAAAGLVAGLCFDDAHIDTGPLARFAGARLYQSAAIGIDIAAKRVICDHRPPVPYDILSINTGSTPNTALVPGAAEYTIPVKPIDRFLHHFEALRARVAQGRSAARTCGRRSSRRRICLPWSADGVAKGTRGPEPARLSSCGAECDFLPGFLPHSPSFRNIAPNGARIVTGDLVARADPGPAASRRGSFISADKCS